MNSQNILEAKLKALTLKILSEIQRNPEIINQELRTFFNDKITGFQYTDKGVVFHHYQQEYTTEVYRSIPGETTISLIKGTPEYESILADINPDLIFLDTESLDSFVQEVAVIAINDEPGLIESKTNKITTIFLNDIYNRPFTSKAVVDVIDVVIEQEKVELMSTDDFEIVLRKPTVDDFQRKTFLPGIGIILSPTDLTRFGRMLSLMIDIKYHGNQPYLIQYEVEKIITILRLFRVSSVYYTSYEMNSEAILFKRGKMLGRIGNMLPSNCLKNLHITEDSAVDLIKFHKDMCLSMPSYIYRLEESNVNYLSLKVAYQHYSKALLSKVGIEEKITNTVIGLESLLLTENQEISFRFWVRGAKILGFLGHSSLRVKNILKLAYNVRSAFVHGDSSELDKKLIKFNDDLQDPDSSLIELLDYLRILIVAMIFLLKNKDFLKENKNKWGISLRRDKLYSGLSGHFGF